MGTSHRVLIVETDAQALVQMKGVLAEMEASVVEARDLEAALSVAIDLAREATPPDVIVVRATLPDGSGLEVLEQIAALFPQARQVLVSHFPKRLLFAIPGFAERRAEFLQAAFTDEQFRKVMERSLARRHSA